jgi:general secretion pathway protein G
MKFLLGRVALCKSKCLHISGLADQGQIRQDPLRDGHRKRSHLATTKGFTLIELMMVLTVISILVSIAIPIASSAILRAKEGVLKSNLHTLRTLIDQYTADKHKAPQSLEDLVSAGYLRAIPKDPVTNSNTTWQVVMEDASLYPDQTETGIFDVKSGSNAISTEGTPYSEW